MAIQNQSTSSKAMGSFDTKVFAPYLEWKLDNDSIIGNPFDLDAKAVFTHVETGKKIETGLFFDGTEYVFRFTAINDGKWTFETHSNDSDLDGYTGTVDVAADPDSRGFVVAQNGKYAQQLGDGSLDALLPNYAMFPNDLEDFYGNPQAIAEFVQTFIGEHGFTGLHIPALAGHLFDIDSSTLYQGSKIDGSQGFDPDPRAFEVLESIITAVHEAGGIVHIWPWGDSQRGQTPDALPGGENGEVHQRMMEYMADRLGPLPGWTLGYGFDNYEWSSPEQAAESAQFFNDQTSYDHLTSVRGGNIATGVTDHSKQTKWHEAGQSLAAYQHIEPDYDVFVAAFEASGDLPVISSDRFRIFGDDAPGRYLTEEQTIDILWESTIAGGVAGIYGNLTDSQGNPIGKSSGSPSNLGSVPYEISAKVQFATWNEFFIRNDRFALDSYRANQLTGGSSNKQYALESKSENYIVIYAEDTNSVELNLQNLANDSDWAKGATVVAVNTEVTYKEVDLGAFSLTNQSINLPKVGDWALFVVAIEGTTPANPSPVQEPVDVPLPTPIVSPPSFEEEAPAGDRVVFDGDSAYIIYHDVAFEKDSGEIQFSFSADSAGGTQALISKDSSGYDNGGHLTLSIVDGELLLRAQNTVESLIILGGTVAANQQNDIRIVWDDLGSISLVLNGKTIGTADNWSGLSDNIEPFVLGASQTRSGDGVADRLKDFFSGEISAFKVVDPSPSESPSQPNVPEVIEEPVAPETPIIVEEPVSPDVPVEEKEPDVLVVVEDPIVPIKPEEIEKPPVPDIPVVVEEPTEPETPDASVYLNGSNAFIIDHETAFEKSSGIIKFLFETDNTIEEQALFSKDSRGYDDGGHLTLSIKDGGLLLRAQNTDKSLVIEGGSVAAGTPNEVTVSWLQDGTLELYLNGSSLGKVDNWDGLSSNLEPIVIGASQTRSDDGVANKLSNFFSGEISGFTVGDVPPVSPDQTLKPIFEIPDELNVIDPQSVLNIAPTTDLNVSEATIVLDFNAKDVGRTAGILSKDAIGYGGGDHLRARIEDGDLTVRFQNSVGQETEFIFENVKTETDYQLAVTFGETGVAAYVNGGLIGEDSHFDMNWLDNNQYLQFGADGSKSASGSGNFRNVLDGTISQIEIYDNQLDVNQITDLYSGLF